MLEACLLEEARWVYDHQAQCATASQAIGYKEFFPYFAGEATVQQCADALKQASRRYAKRQLTWFSHMEGVTWLDAASPELISQALALCRDFLPKG